MPSIVAPFVPPARPIVTATTTDLADLKGDALIAALRRRYDVIDTSLECGGRRFELLRPRSAADMLDEEAFDRDGRIPYWAEVWPAAEILGERLAAEGRARARAFDLLELGCGVGLLSLVAEANGFRPQRVLASDYYPEALDFVRANAWKNDLPEPRTAMLDWRSLPADLPTFDRVVAADVLYEPEQVDLVVGAIVRTLAADGLALVADPGRPTARRFGERCELAGLCVHRERLPLLSAGLTMTIDIYSVRRQS